MDRTIFDRNLICPVYELGCFCFGCGLFYGKKTYFLSLIKPLLRCNKTHLLREQFSYLFFIRLGNA